MTNTIAAYDDASESFALDSLNWVPYDLIDSFLNKIPKGEKILDVGCGAGRDTNIINEKGYNIIGLDGSERLIKYAKAKFPEPEFVHGDIKSLPFQQDSFGGVWCYAVILHLETNHDVKKALNELLRVLKPGGILHIFTKAYISGPKTEIITNYFFKKPRFFRYFEVNELRNLLEEAGFEILEHRKLEESEQRENGRHGVFWISSFARKPS